MLWCLFFIPCYAIAVMLFHLYTRYLSAQRHNFDSKYPPVIIKPWYCPFLGPLLSMLDLEASVNRWCIEYDANFTVFILGKYYTFITKYDDLKKYFYASEEMLSMSRAAHIVLGSAYPEKQYILDYSPVPFLQSILTTRNLHYMTLNIETVVDDYFSKNNGQFWLDNGDEVVIDLFQFMYRLIVRINSINFISFRTYKNHSEQLIDLFAALDFQKNFASPLVQRIKKQFGLKTEKDIAWERWISLLMPDIERCLKMIENNIIPTDFDAMYENVKYSKEELEKHGRPFTPRLVAFMAYMSVVPAHLNTYTTVAYMVLEWIRHEHDEIGQQLKDEVDRAPANGEITMDYLNSMEYSQACIYEVIRMHTDFLLSLRHAGEDVPLSQDKFIPSGNIVISPITSAKDVYTNSHKFDPERHLKPREEMKTDPQRVLPFGRGRHPCIGERYAKMQIKMLLIRLTRACTMELMPESVNFEATINRKQMSGFSQPTKPVFVKISKKE